MRKEGRLGPIPQQCLPKHLRASGTVLGPGHAPVDEADVPPISMRLMGTTLSEVSLTVHTA